MGRVFPIRLMEGSEGHMFCPQKLFRDDYGFTSHLKTLFLSWKLGQVPNAPSVDKMDSDEADTFLLLIRLWEAHERQRDFERLGRLLVGSGDERKVKS